ncbi:hypothetical protein HAX54_022320 [Datura stramonium]|uniref:DUF4094 domain-containing protein n=1 Tax=Datura stramonium TaxID=4076 RepID=A0ABS8UUB2_DATST|nr:hypothetical protein [Datura stramonium]
MVSIAKAANNRVLPADEKKLNSGGRIWVPVSPSALWLPNSKMRSGKLPVSGKTIILLCIASFLGGSLFARRIWTQPNSEMNADLMIPTKSNNEKLRTISGECDLKCDTMLHLEEFLIVPLIVRMLSTNIFFDLTTLRVIMGCPPRPDCMLAATLVRYKSKPRVYIGCMKSGPVLSKKGLKYHEPQYYKFGEEGNKYFRHAMGQIYAISRDLAAYISINSGVCKSVERMKDVHHSCGEGDAAVWIVANSL